MPEQGRDQLEKFLYQHFKQSEFPSLVSHFQTACRTGPCTTVWQAGDVAYRCRTCQTTVSSAICSECFRAGGHNKHDYSMYHSPAGGCCDCGDLSSWTAEGCCPNHQPYSSSSSVPSLPAHEAQALEEALMVAFLSLTWHVQEVGSPAEQTGEVSAWCRWLQQICAPAVVRVIAVPLLCQTIPQMVEGGDWLDGGLALQHVLRVPGPSLVTPARQDGVDPKDCMLRRWLSRLIDLPEAHLVELTTLLLVLLYDTDFKFHAATHLLDYYPSILEITKLNTMRGISSYAGVISAALDRLTVQMFNIEEVTERLLVKEHLLEKLLRLLLWCVKDWVLEVPANQNPHDPNLALDTALHCYKRVLMDLSAVLQHPAAVQHLVKDPVLEDALLSLLELVQTHRSHTRVGMGDLQPPTSRCSTAINLELYSADLVSGLAMNLATLSQNQAASKKLQKSAEDIIFTCMMQVNAKVLGWVSQAPPLHSPTVWWMGLYHGMLAVAPHLCLNRFLAMLARSAFTIMGHDADPHEGVAAQKLLEFVVNGTDSKVDWETAARHVLLLKVMSAQAELHLWVRNGEDVMRVLLFQHYCVELVAEPDLLMLQLWLASKPEPAVTDWLLAYGGKHLLYAAGISPPRDAHLPPPPDWVFSLKDYHIWEGVLIGMDALVRTLRARHLVGSSARQRIRCRLLHSLAVADMKHTQLVGLLGQDLQNLPEVEEELAALAVPTQPSLSQSAKYRLKKECWQEYSPHHAFCSRGEAQQAYERAFKLGGYQPHWQLKAPDPVPAALAGMMRCALSPAVLKLVHFLLCHHVDGSWRSGIVGTQTRSQGLEPHLRERRLTETEAADLHRFFDEAALSSLNLLALALHHVNQLPSEDEAVRHLIAALGGTPQFEPGLLVVLDKAQSSRSSDVAACAAWLLELARKLAARDLQVATRGKSPAEEAAARRKQAKARQMAMLSRMKAQQAAFAASQMADIDTDADSENDAEGARRAAPDTATEDAIEQQPWGVLPVSRDEACVVCHEREETSESGPLSWLANVHCCGVMCTVFTKKADWKQGTHKLPEDSSPLGIIRHHGVGYSQFDSRSGLHVHCCGHQMHSKCYGRIVEGNIYSHTHRTFYHGYHLLNPTAGEVLCPACSRLANCVLPALTFRPPQPSSHPAHNDSGDCEAQTSDVQQVLDWIRERGMSSPDLMSHELEGLADEVPGRHSSRASCDGAPEVTASRPGLVGSLHSLLTGLTQIFHGGSRATEQSSSAVDVDGIAASPSHTRMAAQSSSQAPNILSESARVFLVQSRSRVKQRCEAMDSLAWMHLPKRRHVDAADTDPPSPNLEPYGTAVAGRQYVADEADVRDGTSAAGRGSSSGATRPDYTMHRSPTVVNSTNSILTQETTQGAHNRIDAASDVAVVWSALAHNACHWEALQRPQDTDNEEDQLANTASSGVLSQVQAAHWRAMQTLAALCLSTGAGPNISAQEAALQLHAVLAWLGSCSAAAGEPLAAAGGTGDWAAGVWGQAPAVGLLKCAPPYLDVQLLRRCAAARRQEGRFHCLKSTTWQALLDDPFTLALELLALAISTTPLTQSFPRGNISPVQSSTTDQTSMLRPLVKPPRPSRSPTPAQRPTNAPSSSSTPALPGSSQRGEASAQVEASVLPSSSTTLNRSTESASIPCSSPSSQPTSQALPSASRNESPVTPPPDTFWRGILHVIIPSVAAQALVWSLDRMNPSRSAALPACNTTAAQVDATNTTSWSSVLPCDDAQGPISAHMTHSAEKAPACSAPANITNGSPSTAGCSSHAETTPTGLNNHAPHDVALIHSLSHTRRTSLSRFPTSTHTSEENSTAHMATLAHQFCRSLSPAAQAATALNDKGQEHDMLTQQGGCSWDEDAGMAEEQSLGLEHDHSSCGWSHFVPAGSQYDNPQQGWDSASGPGQQDGWEQGTIGHVLDHVGGQLLPLLYRSYAVQCLLTDTTPDETILEAYTCLHTNVTPSSTSAHENQSGLGAPEPENIHAGSSSSAAAGTQSQNALHAAAHVNVPTSSLLDDMKASSSAAACSSSPATIAMNCNDEKVGCSETVGVARSSLSSVSSSTVPSPSQLANRLLSLLSQPPIQLLLQGFGERPAAHLQSCISPALGHLLSQPVAQTLSQPVPCSTQGQPATNPTQNPPSSSAPQPAPTSAAPSTEPPQAQPANTPAQNQPSPSAPTAATISADPSVSPLHASTPVHVQPSTIHTPAASTAASNDSTTSLPPPSALPSADANLSATSLSTASARPSTPANLSAASTLTPDLPPAAGNMSITVAHHTPSMAPAVEDNSFITASAAGTAHDSPEMPSTTLAPGKSTDPPTTSDQSCIDASPPGTSTAPAAADRVISHVSPAADHIISHVRPATDDVISRENPASTGSKQEIATPPSDLPRLEADTPRRPITNLPIHSLPLPKLPRCPSLLSLPSLFQDLYLHYYNKPCPHCGETPALPALCLITGQFLCSWSNGCPSRHALPSIFHEVELCGGTGAYLMLKPNKSHSFELTKCTRVVTQRMPRQTVCKTVYLDAHGEEDDEMRRGRPLHLNRASYGQISQLWAASALDFDSFMVLNAMLGLRLPIGLEFFDA